MSVYRPTYTDKKTRDSLLLSKLQAESIEFHGNPLKHPKKARAMKKSK
jgi:hypothetical protein